MRIDIINQLAKKGSYFTFEEAKKLMNNNISVTKTILSRYEKKGFIERIEKGKYLIIPLGAQKGEYTINEFIIGSLLIKPYAISYWSALNFYGFTEQIPIQTFIQTTSRKKNQNIKVLGIEFKIVTIKKEKFFGLTQEWINDNLINITDKEKTIIDCLDKPQYCGGILEIAKSLKKMALDINQLVLYAQNINNSAVIRRLGYLCDLLNIDVKLPTINTRNYVFLDPTMPKYGIKNAKWRLIINLDDHILKNLE